jgi:hypothetical protein
MTISISTLISRVREVLLKALPTQLTVSALIGIGFFGWGAWEWLGPGPAKVLIGLIFLLNAVGLGRTGRSKKRVK